MVIDRIKSMHMRPDSVGKVLMIAMMYLFAYRQAEGLVFILDGNLIVLRSVQIVLTVVFGLLHNYAVRECVEGRASAFADGDGVSFPMWTMVMIMIISRWLVKVFTVISNELIGGMTEAAVFVFGILHMILTYIISLVLGALLWKLVKILLQRREENLRKREKEERRRATRDRIRKISSFVEEFRIEDQYINKSQPERYYRRYMYLQDINKEIYNSIRYRVQTGTERNGYVDPKVTNDARDILYDRLDDYDRVFNVTFSVKYYDSLVDDLNRLSRSSHELWNVGFGNMPSFSMTEYEFKRAWADYWIA